MDPIAISICLFRGAVGLVWMILRKRTLKELRKGGDLADEEYRQLILTETDKISLKLDRKSRKDLNTSKSFYKEGLAHLNEVLTNANIKKRDAYTAVTAKRHGCVGRSTFYTAKSVPSLDLKPLKQADLDKSAEEALSQARKAFEQANFMATCAFTDDNLDVAERVEAMYIRLMAKILENMENPANILPSCSHYLEEMHKLPKIKRIFRDVVNKEKKSPFSKEEDMSIFVGVCHIHRIIYDVTQLGHQRNGPWTWPCIQIEESKMVHRIDPLRDVRVAEVHWKLQNQETENVLTGTFHLPVVWSFGSEKDKLISPRDIATNTKGQLIVADNGDCTIKLFDERGTFLNSFSPLSRHLADEDILSVTTDRENNVFVLIKKDKYRYELHLFDRHGKLYHRFPLSEGHVRCSPIINNNNEVLVVIEGKDTKRSAVEVYNTDGEFVKSFGQKILDLKEPKDMTVANEDRFMILNSDGSVAVLDTERNHYQQLDFNHADGIPPEAIAFHSQSKHVVISNSEPGCRVKMSIYNERRQCVHSIYQGDKTSETVKTECVPPKIAVTIDGRIAILAGIVGESKVIVV